MTTGHKRVSNAGRKEDSNENPLFAEMVAASRVLANLAPRSVGLDIGATWLVDGARATIARAAAPGAPALGRRGN